MARVLVLLFVFLSGAIARGSEVELEPCEFSSFPQYAVGEHIRCESLDKAPEGARAPEGKLFWERLHLGENAYTLCFLGENPASATRLFVDRDGDGDFAEEEPVIAFTEYGYMPGIQYNAFDVPGLEARFRMGKAVLPLKMKLRIRPRSSLFTFTCFAGPIEGFCKDFGLGWVPGRLPFLCNLRNGTEFAAFFTAKGCIAPSPDPPALRDGRPVTSWAVGGAGELVALEVPEGVPWISASDAMISPSEAGPLLLSQPEEGKAQLPAGTYNIRLCLRKVWAGAEWHLSTSVRNFEVKPKARLCAIEPLRYVVKATKTAGGIQFFPYLVDASGSTDARISKDGASPGPLELFVTDEAGGKQHFHRFPGGGVHINPVVWEVPKELTGKTLKAELRWVETPFKVILEAATFTP